MKIYDYIKIDMETGRVTEERSFEYSGPVALCMPGGDGGGGADAGGHASQGGIGSAPGLPGLGVGEGAEGSFGGRAGQGGAGSAPGLPGVAPGGAPSSTSVVTAAKTGFMVGSAISPALGIIGAMVGGLSAVGANQGGGLTGMGVTGAEGGYGVGGGPDHKTATKESIKTPAMQGGPADQTTRPGGPGAAETPDTVSEAEKAAAERRREARRRAGYWSTRLYSGVIDPSMIYTPTLQ